MEDAGIYHKNLKVLSQQVRWRDMIIKSFKERYDILRRYVIRNKYRLGTKYLRWAVERSFDKYITHRDRWSLSNDMWQDWFKAPANAEGIIEIIEAFTDDGDKVMKDWMEERKDAGRTYETELWSVLRALDNHREEVRYCNGGDMF